MSGRGPGNGNGKKGRARAGPPDEARPYLAAALAHDARNVLNSMGIRTELLRGAVRDLAAGRAEASPKATRSLEEIDAAVTRLAELLTTYVDRVGPGEGVLRPTAVATVLAAAAARAEARAKPRGVRVEVSAPAGETWLLDEDALAVALDALIANAVEASPRGGVVAVRAVHEDDDLARIEVRDRGEGIAPDALPGIFRVGFTTRRGHLGLGLCAAKHAVRAHPGADLGVRGDPGGGVVAEIRFQLDLHEDE